MRAGWLGACGHGFCQNQDLRDYRIFRILFGARPHPSWRGFLLCEKRGLGGERFVRIRIYGIIGFSGFFGRFGARPHLSWRDFLLCETRGWAANVLSESGFTGLWDFQDSFRRASVSVLAGFSVMREARVGRRTFCQNQDLRDYRIFRILLALRCASVSVLAGFPFMAKRAVGRQRNPENPANPENPDSDKSARANHNARRPMDSRFRGNDGVESGIDCEIGIDSAATAHSSPMPTNR